ncbi:MAG TPA: hypothetical protein VK928_11330, partial [Longimicrobiales bacterium]|nr:hypothetical protein [Longimicrobiales bacterium]
MTITSADAGRGGHGGDTGAVRPLTPAVDGTRPRLLKLPLLGGLTRPVRLLGLAAGSAMILFLAAVQPRLYPDLPIAVLYVLPVVLV